jgi:DUF971 family protein
MEKPRPAGIQIDRNERLVKIVWSDDHKSSYPFDGLRAACPCVECRGGHSHMGAPPDRREVLLTPATELTVENVQQLGSYALQFQWSDGHWTGIYTWEFLRQACPCPECLPRPV